MEQVLSFYETGVHSNRIVLNSILGYDTVLSGSQLPMYLGVILILLLQ